MARPKVKPQEFTGKAAYLAQRAAPPAALLCTLTVDDHASASGELRYMLGGEPILTRDGAPLADAKGRPSYVTSAGSGPSVGRHLLMAYLPPEQAVAGTAARGRVPRRALPGHRGRRRVGPAVRPRGRADPPLTWRSESASSASRRSAAGSS